MLFNSFAFLFAFLPLTLLGFFWIGRLGHEPAIAWLILASLFFYGWWNPVYVPLIIASMLVNFGIGRRIGRDHQHARRAGARALLVLGITFNLGLLGWYKYANFGVDTLNTVLGTDLHLQQVLLPLAISFFTFQQIAYLVDAYQGITREYRFSHYLLFVTFFPQLIAGPIVHHKEMLPQFPRREALQPHVANIAVGGTIFVMGLFKKTVLADGIAVYATPVFDRAAAGDTLTFFEAWGGALAYTWQLYFDFSGYSDMAIGAARLFGIRLPQNFHSPYKATSIVEFWRRWHMTLSRFLRDYLYIPLGGNRHGPVKRYRNLFLTMLLGGLWHGAGWTFVIWGALHGLYLVVNHAWQRLWAVIAPRPLVPGAVARLLAWSITFLAVVVGWVFFRAADMDAALRMLAAMCGMHGVALPNAIAVSLGALWPVLSAWGVGTYLGGGTDFALTWAWVLALAPIALMMPNSMQIMARFKPVLKLYSGDDRHELRLLPMHMQSLHWRPTAPVGMATGVCAALAILAMSRVSEFLYFQF
ncbi:MBOAT family protein [uncultured Thiohalocapsa sp.]|uniref:MBOAT family O-acyltransferase n=1 Tax=uncultured Thiohalocapsa sp. TaxID=768990 RepID=UPI0025E7357A|nr:MBOAT family protein [uncultured Thiohalocapsa sp.]